MYVQPDNKDNQAYLKHIGNLKVLIMFYYAIIVYGKH